MRRREFIAGLAGAAAWPVVAQGQRPAMPAIGYLATQSADDEYKNNIVPFLQGLKETGYVEGQNVLIEYRLAAYQYDRLPALAADLVRRRVAVIVASATVVALAAKAATTTTTIPIVFVVCSRGCSDGRSGLPAEDGALGVQRTVGIICEVVGPA